jgi:hypothetical protein
MKPENVINGTFGEVWLDGDYLAEVKKFSATVEGEFEDIKLPRKLGKYKKMIGYEGKGEVEFYHATSRMMARISEDLQNGKQTEVSIISNLADPDALGYERVLIKDAVLASLTLADWEAAKIGERTVPFTFTEWQFLDEIR